MSCLLVVDDEQINREIIAEFLPDHELVFAQDGLDAWQKLQASPKSFDAVILDRVMPRMDGMALLLQIKTDKRFDELPLIMQTSESEPSQVAEGLAAGAWYYLAKPYSNATLNSIVDAALADQRGRRELAILSQQIHGALSLTQRAVFYFRSPEESRLLAAYMSKLCQDEGMVAMGLSELLLNAVEHGNLSLSYQDKSRLLEEGNLQERIDQLLASPEQTGRWAELEFVRETDCLRFTVRDQGTGFDWNKYLEMDPARAFDSHGRGIAMARQLAFPSIQYQGCGNTVTVTAKPKEKQ